MIRLILVAVFLVLFLLVSIPIFFIEWIIMKFNRDLADRSGYAIVKWALRVIGVLAGAKITVIGHENIPTDRPVLYVGNHRSFFDIVVTVPLYVGVTGLVAKESLMKIPLFGFWMKRIHCLSIDREDPREALKTIQQATEQVKSGISMAIYPEGTRNKHPEDGLMTFKEGSLRIAEKANCPIVPVAIVNTEQIFEAHFPWIRKTDVIVEFAPAIDVASLSRQERKGLGHRCQDLIQEIVDRNEAQLRR